MGRRLAALCALVMGGAVAACAAVTGIDGYTKGDCSGGGDCDASAADSSVVPDGHTRVPDATSDTGPAEEAGDDASDSASNTGDADASGDATDAAHDARADAPSEGGAEGGTDGATDGASDAADAHPGDAGDGGCGPLNTATNCGACGVACSTTNATSESCVTEAGAETCSYVCNPGFANCPTAPPNTGGCSTSTTTTTNCGGCGNACKLTSASGATCNGVTCAYTCIANHSDCNLATAPDTDGCECATPGCCGGSCQTTHSTGTGQSYYDCNPTGTFTAVTAIEACTAYAQSVGGTAANCSDGWSCNSKAPFQVCYGDTTGTTCQTFCWGYGGSQAGVLYTCACPLASAGSWN